MAPADPTGPSRAAAAPPPSPRPSLPPARTPLAFTVAADGPPGALVGVDRARVVVEYPLADDRTGLLTILDTDAEVVGPLRWSTPSDVALAEAFAADLVTAGATGTVVTDLAAAGLRVIEEHTVPGALVRDPARRAPANLYAAPDAVRAVIDERTVARWWPGAPAGAADGTPAPATDQVPPAPATPSATDQVPRDEVAVTMAPDVTVTWTWDPATAQWLRTTGAELDQTATGRRLSATEVVVLEVRPVSNRPAVVADVVGAGAAVVLRAATLRSARWQRADGGPPRVVGAAAGPVAGAVWVQVCAAPCVGAR